MFFLLLHTPKDKGHEGRGIADSFVEIHRSFQFASSSQLRPLHDPITNSEVIGDVDFNYDHFSVKEEIRLTKEIVGKGDKIKVTSLPKHSIINFIAALIYPLKPIDLDHTLSPKSVVYEQYLAKL